MGSYSTIANEVSSSNSTYDSYVSSKYKTSTFDGLWSGPASVSLLGDLTTVLKNVTTNDSNVSSFVAALNNLDKYKEKKELIKSKNTEIENSITILKNTVNNEQNAATINNLRDKIDSLSDEVSSLTTETNTLRTSINTSLNSISSISSSITVIDRVDVSGDLDGYVVSLYDLLQSFQSGRLSLMNGNLYNYYSKEEVDSTLDKVHQQYSGRDAAVNSALSVISLASQKGVKLDYVWGGGHHSGNATTADVAAGTDCSGFVSWAIDQGTSGSFQNETTDGLIREGRQVSYESAQRGDILVSGGHAVLIVDNDPDTKTFLVAEASSPSVGVVVRTRSYSSIYGEYQARDLSNLYGN